MAIQKPYNLMWNSGQQTIDGKLQNTLSWQVSGSIQTSYAITILDNSTNAVVFSVPQTTSYATNYTLPANTLSNGKTLKVQVTVWAQDASTASSDYLIFSTSTTPVVTVNTPSVAAPSYTFSATYTQAELVALANWQCFLYDNNYNLINQSGIQTSSTLSYMFTGLVSNQVYYIEFQATSAKGLVGDSGKVQFTPVYSQPQLNSLLTATNYQNASIQLSWDVLVIKGTTSGTTAFVNNNTALDVTNGSVVFNDGFSLWQDGTIKLFIINPANKKDLIILQGANGTLRLQYWVLDNKFHLFKTPINSNITVEYVSEPVVGISFFVGIENVGLEENLWVEVVS